MGSLRGLVTGRIFEQRAFKKLTRRNRKLDTNTNLAKSKGKRVVINEEPLRREKKKKLVRQIEAKNSLLDEKIANLEATLKKITSTQSILKKLGFINNKLNEILAIGSRDSSKCELSYVNKRGKIVQPIVFFKEKVLLINLNVPKKG
ncbi:hypothetical protein J1N35_022141 [Gossypium stocksii]|uniref:Uncharacterized protein n=1 Tax=Gossypium stocksii TaxID=47602 RepID=A0A9D3VFW6_9ROSI|nr:hypothetical protein J1N35_022141 [Gossypium stocksii]